MLPVTMTDLEEFKARAWPSCTHLKCSEDCDFEGSHCARLAEAAKDFFASETGESNHPLAMRYPFSNPLDT